ncbi:2TM domain-containing protein [Merismopedia glauca]|uniref:2TM domain-containing protein n=1 Tax=Merismopedia glauca CCAP 1448/3 TaxID=1296344 RepID=A0A2T1C7Y9_9CYAN|nr:2TM domain-containing protein [Merismopedia glauca]PSB04344.1 hypothetical protein C7B64_04565 [Merismopedia glauca CCAP 1448/3]
MAEPESSLTRSYSQEEIQEILQLAIAKQADERDFSPQQLQEIAIELGISPDAIAQAEKTWLTQGIINRHRQEFELYRRTKWQKQLGNFAIVNLFLIALNILNAGEISWSLYVLLFWGLKIVRQAWNQYKASPEDDRKALQKWYRQQQSW